jgi:hypothetical protein
MGTSVLTGRRGVQAMRQLNHPAAALPAGRSLKNGPRHFSSEEKYLGAESRRSASRKNTSASGVARIDVEANYLGVGIARIDVEANYLGVGIARVGIEGNYLGVRVAGVGIEENYRASRIGCWG